MAALLGLSLGALAILQAAATDRCAPHTPPTAPGDDADTAAPAASLSAMVAAPDAIAEAPAAPAAAAAGRRPVDALLPGPLPTPPMPPALADTERAAFAGDALAPRWAKIYRAAFVHLQEECMLRIRALPVDRRRHGSALVGAVTNTEYRYQAERLRALEHHIMSGGAVDGGHQTAVGPGVGGVCFGVGRTVSYHLPYSHYPALEAADRARRNAKHRLDQYIKSAP